MTGVQTCALPILLHKILIKKGIGDIMEGARSVKGKNKSKRKLDKLKNIDFEPIKNFDDPIKLKKETVWLL